MSKILLCAACDKSILTRKRIKISLSSKPDDQYLFCNLKCAGEWCFDQRVEGSKEKPGQVNDPNKQEVWAKTKGE